MAELLNGSEHEQLFQGPSRRVGEIHLYIQKATAEMERKRDPEEIHKSGKVINLADVEPNEFSREVGGDEIRWWVFKRETNHAELLERTQEALAAAQILKVAAHSVKDQYDVPTYQELVQKIKEFTETHDGQIKILHEYVLWLHQKDVLAPIILATYRVWGSTRLHEKRVETSADTPEDNEEILRLCTEIALGLWRRSRYTIERVYSEISSAIAESVDPESPAYYQPIKVPEDQLAVRTAHEVLDELATYFELIRQSLRNIILEIEQYQTPENLLDRAFFWATFVGKAMRRPLEQSWDFKETLSMWHAKGTEKQISSVEFCEHVAAFANAEGGVLIIGVTDKLPRKVVGIADLESRLKATREALQRRLVPPPDFIRLIPITLEDEHRITQNCLVIVVSQTKDGVSVRGVDNRFSYPLRVETGLDRVDPGALRLKKANVSTDNWEFIRRLYLNFENDW